MTPMPTIKAHHHNSLYLVVALIMIFMTLILALQPLYLKNVLQLGRENAGFVNSNIQVITELVDLLFVGYLGYLSDRFGRIPVMRYGFLLAGWTALLAPFSLELGLLFGINGLALFYLSRAVISIGSTAVWPQLATLAGDYSDVKNRPALLAKVGFMMAFGATLVYAILLQLPRHAGVVPVMFLPAIIAFWGAWLTRNKMLEVATQTREKKFPLKTVINLVKEKRALRLSFLSAFSSRNDMVLVGLFLMTWFIYYSDLMQNVDHNQAASKAGLVIGFIGAVVLVTIRLWGYVIDRVGRITTLTIGLALSGIGFVSLGMVVDPLSWWPYVPAVFIGLGQAACLLSSQTLALDLSPEKIRGSVMGVFNTVGIIGIIFFLQVGGLLFDWVSPTAPFILTGAANFLIMAYGLLVMKLEPEEGGSPLYDEL
ncbi:MAG: MFS transporter [Magnetococcales bacterium]|nr:MFS transporter [Magnetococcales bacterium]